MKTSTHRRAFSLVELLVVITLIVMLVAMMATALNAARASGAKQKTKAWITMLDEILQQHFRSMESISVEPGVDRGAAIRRRITADMPDSWQEVAYLKDHSSEFNAARHRGYVATLDAGSPSTQNASAECLFMIVMQGGLADCLDCAGLASIPVGDVDGDGYPEFLDAWGMPIRYVLWPGGFELPIGTKFFDQSNAPFSAASNPTFEGGTMRPLIVSGGPSKEDATKFSGFSYLDLGPDVTQCGNPANSEIMLLGGHDSGLPDKRSDNITNFDDEVKR